MMMPSVKLMTEAPPSIPSQRAVIKWDGKTEIMLVESVLSGKAGRYGWVVPIPKAPSYVRSVKPDYVEGAFQRVKPLPRKLDDPDPSAPVVLGVLFALAFLSAGYRYRKLDPDRRMQNYLIEAFVALVVFGIWHSAVDPRGDRGYLSAKSADAAAPAAGGTEGLSVQSYGTIGSYEVNVLKAETGKPVLEWLEKHEIVAPKTALDAIDQYAKEKWVFLAAEFRKDSDRPLPPHPLKAVFDTDKPVYPMRLTGAQDAPLFLEMLVISDQRAKIEGMKAWTCTNEDILVPVRKDARDDEDVYTDWSGEMFAMAKYGNVSTYLRANLQPSDMKRDFEIGWEPFERFRAEVYDLKEAQVHALLIGALWLGLTAFVAGFWPLLAGCKRYVVLTSVLVALSAGLAMGTKWYSGVEKVETLESFYDGDRLPMG